MAQIADLNIPHLQGLDPQRRLDLIIEIRTRRRVQRKAPRTVAENPNRNKRRKNYSPKRDSSSMKKLLKGVPKEMIAAMLEELQNGGDSTT
jgi:hypothetical protein